MLLNPFFYLSQSEAKPEIPGGFFSDIDMILLNVEYWAVQIFYIYRAGILDSYQGTSQYPKNI